MSKFITEALCFEGMFREEIPYPAKCQCRGFVTREEDGHYLVTELTVTHGLTRVFIAGIH